MIVNVNVVKIVINANKWVNGPIKNPKAKQWIKDMLRLKKAGIK